MNKESDVSGYNCDQQIALKMKQRWTSCSIRLTFDLSVYLFFPTDSHIDRQTIFPSLSLFCMHAWFHLSTITIEKRMKDDGKAVLHMQAIRFAPLRRLTSFFSLVLLLIFIVALQRTLVDFRLASSSSSSLPSILNCSRFSLSLDSYFRWARQQVNLVSKK